MENIEALHDICDRQLLNLKFPFSQFPLPMNVTVLACTDGKSSLFFKVCKSNACMWNDGALCFA